MLTDDELKELILKQPRDVQVAMFHLRYDPRSRYSTRMHENPPSEAQSRYMGFLARQKPETWQLAALVLDNVWDYWTCADASFAIDAMDTPVIDFMESAVRAYRKDIAHALSVAGPMFAAGIADDISRQMREMADDLQHVRYHILDRHDGHGKSVDACYEIVSDLDGEAVADSFAPAPAAPSAKEDV